MISVQSASPEITSTTSILDQKIFSGVIDLRSQVKAKSKRALLAAKERLDSEQQALKILANSTSYGIFVEFIIESLDAPELRTCFGAGKPFKCSVSKGEEPGRYFHPLLATLITGAARLMLAITETSAIKSGLDWAFCDTDSMAVAKPPSMSNAEFLSRAKNVCEWFSALNPYEQKGPLLKIEDGNYSIKRGKRTDRIEVLHCYAISAKRYVLFNIGVNGRPIIRKASAHGLGHLLPPYSEQDAPKQFPTPAVSLSEIGVDRWQHDLWYRIITAALDGHPDQVDLTYHPGLSQPAASRYGATTPKLQRWFNTYNQNRSYREQVKPHNFMLAFQVRSITISDFNDPTVRKSGLKPIAPYNKDIRKASRNCFDRETGEPIPPEHLKTYREAVAQYHVSPESKFLNAEYLDRGSTQRRHIELLVPQYIGKEASHWEQQFHLGFEEDEQIEYGMSSIGLHKVGVALRRISNDLRIGQRSLASEIGISRETLSKILGGQPVNLSTAIMVKVLRAVARLGSNSQFYSGLAMRSDTSKEG